MPCSKYNVLQKNVTFLSIFIKNSCKSSRTVIVCICFVKTARRFIYEFWYQIFMLSYWFLYFDIIRILLSMFCYSCSCSQSILSKMKFHFSYLFGNGFCCFPQTYFAFWFFFNCCNYIFFVTIWVFLMIYW